MCMYHEGLVRIFLSEAEKKTTLGGGIYVGEDNRDEVNTVVVFKHKFQFCFNIGFLCYFKVLTAAMREMPIAYLVFAN